MNGPTTVPCRVFTASTATARFVIRFITLSCSSTMCSELASQSLSCLMKNVVLPESPYGVCTTRSLPSSADPARSTSSDQLAALPRTFGTDGAPASLPSCVVTIFESRCRRNESAGKISS